MENHRDLVHSLVSQGAFPDSSGQHEIIETHISTVVLTGDQAYKFKKGVNFGFLDFSTLEARKHFCEEELRLNQRLAPGLYLEVVAITGSPEQPEINGSGEAFEYAICMRQFDQQQLLDKKLADGTLQPQHIDEIADQAASFHQGAEIAPSDSVFCKPSSIYAPMEQNFRQLEEFITDPVQVEQLGRIEHWTREQFSLLAPALETRGKAGFIRECHGDMHLGNITLMDGAITIFDGIEFNDEFRWIDVMSEMAFVTMDLTDRDASSMANRLLNRYLEQTGDYAGLALLRFYQVYRAMVRAKIASFRLADPQLSDSDRKATLTQYQSYADLAEHFSRAASPRLVLMHGVSASGKSTVSQELSEQIDAIRLRSDVERKRLFTQQEGSSEAVGTGIYSEAHSRQTYDHLLKQTRALLDHGFAVVVDAAFLKHGQRSPFLCLAAEENVPFAIIALECPADTLRQRLLARTSDVSDATLTVLEHQLDTVQAPRSDESVITVNTESAIDFNSIVNRLTH